MNTKTIIAALNLTEGAVLTLEKAADRMEFEALPIFSIGLDKSFGRSPDDSCRCYGSYEPNNCDSFCMVDICSCVGPQGYISQDQCHPYKG